MTASDEQLIEEYQVSKSRDTLDQLVSRHIELVRNVAYRIVLCNAIADDVTQDVFVKVMHHADTFRGKANRGTAKFSTWLYTITVNTAKEHLRRRRATTSINHNEDAAANPSHNRPEQQVMDDELSTQIEQALAKLTVKLRTAVVLTSIEQLPPKEAAKIEGCSTATMHWRVHQARKQLKQFLHKYL